MTKLHLALARTLITLAYAGTEGTGEGTGTQKTETGGGAAKTFTQEDVNQLVAAERRILETRSKNLLGELEALKTKSSLTAKEREDLETRLETTRQELMTKEELANEKLGKLQKQRDQELAALTGERDTWKTRHTQSMIQRSISDAAAAAEAFNARQLVALLAPDTHLVEDTDEDGKPTGEFSVMVKFQDVNKDGKPVKLDLPVNEAVKRLKEKSEYQNLFKGLGTGGTGSSNKGGGKGSLSIAELAKNDPAEYARQRAAGTLKLPQ